MGIFDSIFGKSNKKWTPKPFYLNKTKTDFQEWFSNVPEWAILDYQITNALIERLINTPYFELFMFTSLEQNLIKEYIPLKSFLTKECSNIVIYSKIAAILGKSGEAYYKKAHELAAVDSSSAVKGSPLYNNISKALQQSMDAFESAIRVEPRFLPPYVYMVKLKKITQKDSEAMVFCTVGLATINDIKKSPLPPVLQAEVEEVEIFLKSFLNQNYNVKVK